MILVAGGSGFIGSALVKRLVREGSEVAVMTAHRARSEARIRSMGARPIEGDVREEASVARAVAGAEVVVHVLTFPTFPIEKPRKRYTFEEFDHLSTQRLVQAAAGAGARRFVFASGAGASPGAAKVWFRAKWDGEEAIRASGISHAIIRPSWVYGPEDQALNRIVAFHRWLPFVPVVGDGHQLLQPVFVDDVAEVFAQAARPDGPEGTFEIGGPDVFTMNDVLTTMMDVLGRRKPLVHFPVSLTKVATFVFQFAPVVPLSPSAVDWLIGDALADTAPLLGAFDLDLTPLAQGLSTYLRS